jgi:hypothetical protein
MSYRLLRAIYSVSGTVSDDLARAMVNVAIQGAERGGRVFENRDIRAMVKSTHPSAR